MVNREVFYLLKGIGPSRGSISLTMLIMCFFLAFLAQLALHVSNKEFEYSLKHFQNRQLRTLCYSAMSAASPRDFAAGNGSLTEAKLEPGGEKIRLSYTSRYSDDSLLQYFELEAAALNDKNAVQRLRVCNLILPEKLVNLASHYPLIYGSRLEGKEYLTGIEIYTSSEEDMVPQIGFLKGIGINPVNDEEMSRQGLNKRFYFVDSDNTVQRFLFTGGRKFYGSTVFASSGSISIGNSCVFPDRIIFISERGSIDIGSNVQMNNAIVIAKNKVRIGEGCRIKGVIYADCICIEGNSSFLTDENIVAQFSSGYFIS